MSFEMIIAIDVDGVLLDFCKGFADWWNAKYSDHVVDDNPGDWNFGYEGSHKVLEKRIGEFLNSHPTLPEVEVGIGCTFNLLREKHEVHIVTEYPLHGRDSRMENLRSLGFDVSDNMVHFSPRGTKPEFLRDVLRPKVVIDDHPVYIRDLSQNGVHVLYPLKWRYLLTDFEREKPDERAIGYQSFHDVPSLIDQIVDK